MMPSRKPAGMATTEGLVSGNHAKSMLGIMAVSAPETAGEKMISTIEVSSPP